MSSTKHPAKCAGDGFGCILPDFEEDIKSEGSGMKGSEMKVSRWIRMLKNPAFSVLLTGILLIGLNIAMKGMFLMGKPKAEEVVRVEILYPEADALPREFSDAEPIELACSLMNFLNYRPFKQVQEDDAPLITITYILTDGSSRQVSASRQTVWWQGKKYALKDEGFFVNLAEGIFY